MEIDIQAASGLLWNAWHDGRVIDALPDELRPRSRSEGYAVQASFADRSAASPAGWKIAATSGAGQRHINVDGPLAGRILAGRVHSDGACLSMRGNRMRVAEPEFVFRVGRPLPPRDKPYGRDEVVKVVDGFNLGIEFPDSRYLDFVTVGEAQLIADNACAHEFVLGPEVLGSWKGIDLAAHRVRAMVTGSARAYEREGEGANVLGDPYVALTWLVNELSSLRITLMPDQFVTTGTCMTPLGVEPGDEVTVDYGAFGCMTCRFEA
ncbi:2-keto-4-pentenoate hydratase [Paraburkholderia sp. J12]|uniref:2-keto-4-pentenoate hydratase n=1 Tax=Paraburkholderia sp. J12 TaxID=2805432 RepID=UPI002ABDA560|nr:fumarylacetoacetate hydrolase family protein [Paraburkholderia sp. J12]